MQQKQRHALLTNRLGLPMTVTQDLALGGGIDGDKDVLWRWKLDVTWKKICQ